MIEIKVPKVGESIYEVTLLKWLKKDGEYVDRDDVIAELESEKATFEVNAEQSGVIKLIAQEGATLNIGDVLANIDEKAQAPVAAVGATVKENNQPAKSGLTKPQVIEQESEKESETANQQPPPPTTETRPAGKGIIELKVPAVGESISEVTLLKWLKNTGDLVKRDEVIAELESEKATFELNADEAGELKQAAKEGETIKIGVVIAT